MRSISIGRRLMTSPHGGRQVRVVPVDRVVDDPPLARGRPWPSSCGRSRSSGCRSGRAPGVPPVYPPTSMRRPSLSTIGTGEVPRPGDLDAVAGGRAGAAVGGGAEEVPVPVLAGDVRALELVVDGDAGLVALRPSCRRRSASARRPRRSTSRRRGAACRRCPAPTRGRTSRGSCCPGRRGAGRRPGRRCPSTARAATGRWPCRWRCRPGRA